MVATTILIRTKNEAAELEATLQAIFRQTYRDFELIIIDSGSTDETLEIASRFPIRVIHYQGERYRPGRSMNQGAAAAKGKYLLYLSAHAQPLDNEWLGRLIGNFRDENVAACYGRLVPRPVTDPYQLLFNYGIFQPAMGRRENDRHFSAVNGAIRQALWSVNKFNEETPLREDAEWTKRIISQGYRIVYDPSAAVYHTHYENCSQVYGKSFKAYYSWKIHDHIFTFSLIKEIKDLISVLKRGLLLLLRGKMSIVWFFRLVKYWLYRTVGFYLGYRQATIATQYLDNL